MPWRCSSHSSPWLVGKREQRRAPVAEHRDAHVVAEPRRVPGVMFDVHTASYFFPGAPDGAARLGARCARRP